MHKYGIIMQVYISVCLPKRYITLKIPLQFGFL